MSLLPITEAEYDVEIALAYATSENFTGRPIYRRARCYLHAAAAAALRRADAGRGPGLSPQDLRCLPPERGAGDVEYTPDPSPR
jgi:D-alanyl-D-alanine dipeptidase